MNDQIADFLIELRADRAATKEKEKREVWTKFTSLSIVFIAVMARGGDPVGRKIFLAHPDQSQRSHLQPGIGHRRVELF